MATAIDRFWNHVLPEPNTGCWLWMGHIHPGPSNDKTNGYGQFQVNNKRMPAHRFAYETFVCEVPYGLEIDHKCKMPCCVNPDHLDAVTHKENMLRSTAIQKAAAVKRAKTHCPRGHEYSGDNLFYKTSGGRACRECFRAHARASYHRRKNKNG